MLKKTPDESKTIEYYTFAQDTQQRSNQEVKPVIIIMEEDKEEETELSTIISTVTGDTEDSIWINAKTTTAKIGRAHV